MAKVRYLPVEKGNRLGIGNYPSFSASGSISGMKKQFYGKDALLVKCGSYIYNVSSKPDIYYAANESFSKAGQVISLLEENESDADKLAGDIRKSIFSIFPSSYVDVKFRTTLGSPAVDIFFLLGKDKSEWINGIEHNDPAYTRISVYGMDKEGVISKPLSLNLSTGGSFLDRKSVV